MATIGDRRDLPEKEKEIYFAFSARADCFGTRYDGENNTLTSRYESYEKLQGLISESSS